MKTRSSLKFFLTLSFMLTILIPLSVSAQNPFYKMANPGTDDLNDFDRRFRGELAVGRRYNKNFATETGLGYFSTQTQRETTHLFVIPATLTLKSNLPYNKWEFVGLGGVACYIASCDFVDDAESIFGEDLGLGFHYNVTPTFFVGAEGNYVWTSDVKLKDEAEVKFNTQGIFVTAVVGFRF